jgi:hypothetical protein
MTNIQSEATDDSMREEQIGKAGTTVKEGVISSLAGVKEIEAEIVSLAVKAVREMLVGVVESVKEVASTFVPKPKKAA